MERSPLQLSGVVAPGTKKRGQAGPGNEQGSGQPPQSGDSVQLPPSAAEGPAAAPEAPQKKSSKAPKIDLVVPEEPHSDLAFFFFDIETTSNNKKNHDRIIELAIIAYTSRGEELERWERRFLITHLSRACVCL